MRTITIEDYNSNWPVAYQKEAERLKNILKKEILWIEHIGSTAIPDLCAKPIIDILIAVRNIKAIDQYDTEMGQQDFWAKGEFGIPDRRFFIKGEKGKLDETRSCHVHIFEIGNLRIASHLNFKYYLIDYPDVARQYGALKRSLATKFPHNISAYMQAREPFLQEIEQKIPKYLAELSLETERLILRPFRLEDADAIYTYMHDKTIADSTDHIPYPYTREMALDWLRGHRAACLKGEQSVFALTLKENHELIGAVGCFNEPKHCKADLGYWMGKKHRRKGYCTEAVREMLKFGFLRLSLHRIAAHCFSKNVASEKLLLNVGMQHEGHLREDMMKWGEFRDVDLYGILVSEFECIPTASGFSTRRRATSRRSV